MRKCNLSSEEQASLQLPNLLAYQNKAMRTLGLAYKFILKTPVTIVPN